MRMITVSPTAREAPSTSAATTPESAAGKTTRIDVCTLLAPRPAAPSRSDCGTADIASSTTDAIVGSDEDAEDDARRQGVELVDAEAEQPRSTSGVKNVRAK